MGHRIAILFVIVLVVGPHVAIWSLLGPQSLGWAAALSTAVSLLQTKFFTMGPSVNFLTPLAVRHDDLFFVHCIEKGVNPGIIRRVYRHLPSDPRCRLCLFPFRGVGTAFHVVPSKKNPNFCQSCIEYAPFGIYDMEAGILFADVRGYTAWSEAHSARETADRMTAFYRVANRVFTRDDVILDFIGDQVMVIYLPLFPALGDHTAQAMVTAAQRFQTAIQREFDTDTIEVGIGIHMGEASVGNVGDRYAKDFTAMGDVVNTASRLQSCAKGGEIVMSREVFDALGAAAPAAREESFTVKGKSEPVAARVIEGSPPKAPARA